MRRVIVAVAVVALVGAACGSDSDGSPEATQSEVQEPDITEPAVGTGSSADLAITEVAFDDHVTISNLGTGAVSVDGLWLCNRPNYVPLPTVLIAPGESIDITEFTLPASGGEVALYTSNNFGDSSAMVDYVAWGSGGGRTEVAVDAGLWPEGDSVVGAGVSISAPDGGASSSDWSVE